MAYNSNAEVVLVGQIAGQICYTQLEYHRETVVPAFSAQALCDYAYNNWWDGHLKGLVSDQFTLLEIRAKCIQSPGPQIPEYVRGVGEQGDISGDVMPAFVTVVMVKVPDNSTKYPTTTEDFRNGRASFSGLPEADCNAGMINSSPRAAWDSFFEALETLSVTVGGTPYPFTLGLERGEVSPPKCLVAETYCRQKLGTQNTRKR